MVEHTMTLVVPKTSDHCQIRIIRIQVKAKSTKESVLGYSSRLITGNIRERHDRHMQRGNRS